MDDKRAVVNYREMQRHLASRQGTGLDNCNSCQRFGYDLLSRLSDEFKAFNKTRFRQSASFAGYVWLCASCMHRASYAWIADIRPELFEDFVKHQEGAFALDGLRELLPQGHPQFEPTLLGSTVPVVTQEPARTFKILPALTEPPSVAFKPAPGVVIRENRVRPNEQVHQMLAFEAEALKPK
jgi:hypothetical protein